MMLSTPKIAMLPLVLLMSACVEGGKERDNPFDEAAEIIRRGPDALSFADLVELNDGIEDGLPVDDEGIPVLTAAENFPAPGNITYTGSAALNEYVLVVEQDESGTFEEEDATYLAGGQSTVVYDIGTGVGSGRVYDFFEIDLASLVDADGNDAPSEDFTGRAIVGELNYDAARNVVTGQITKTSGEVATFTLTVAETEFLGTNAEVFSTYSDGTSTATGREAVDASLTTLGRRP